MHCWLTTESRQSKVPDHANAKTATQHQQNRLFMQGVGQIDIQNDLEQ